MAQKSKMANTGGARLQSGTDMPEIDKREK